MEIAAAAPEMAAAARGRAGSASSATAKSAAAAPPAPLVQTDGNADAAAHIAALHRRIAELEKTMQARAARKTSAVDGLRMKCNRLEYAAKEAVILLSNALENNARQRFPHPNPVPAAADGEWAESVRFSLRFLEQALAATRHISPAGHVRPAAVTTGCAAGLAPKAGGGPTTGRKNSEIKSPFERLVLPRLSELGAGGTNPPSPTAATPTVKYAWAISPTATTFASLPWIEGPQTSGARFPQEHHPSPFLTTKASERFLPRCPENNVSVIDGGSSPAASGVTTEPVQAPEQPVAVGSPETKPDRTKEDLRVRTRTLQRASSSPLHIAKLTSTKCPNCLDLYVQIDRLQDGQSDMKRDIDTLRQHLVEEQHVRAQVTVAKELLEREMEDLTASLFEQANAMVMEEAELRELAERRCAGLDARLQETESALAKTERELRHVNRARMEKASASNMLSACSTSLPNITMPIEQRTSIHLSQPAIGSAGNGGTPVPANFPTFPAQDPEDRESAVYVDGVAFSEFQEHVKDVAKAKDATVAALSTQFVRRVMSEDVDACLFQNAGAWKTTAARERLFSALARSAVEIRHWSSKSADSRASASDVSRANGSVSSLSKAPEHSQLLAAVAAAGQPMFKPLLPHVKCSACGIPRDCEYQVRVLDPSDEPAAGRGAEPPPPPPPRAATGGAPGSGHVRSAAAAAVTAGAELSSWQPLDRFCKDRVAAVCDFYIYLSHLRGAMRDGSTPVLDLFRQAIWHRRRMSLARVGGMAAPDGAAPEDGVSPLPAANPRGVKITTVR
ncbi:MAG: hypothetical protein BJ554DRAFT_8416 [Olpidium bornovanus]|uniref:GDP/GTP exchange factor Sec2 N-terminal domain-containing protein n=1 Tax=Olpidium bornovanus TaxID=278681 RepID=A0A8H8DIM0_9FUNG|nr:MAG: hypothetical protein BJ554DRAFT_8416 [Olpidium bornovanus]